MVSAGLFLLEPLFCASASTRSVKKLAGAVAAGEALVAAGCGASGAAVTAYLAHLCAKPERSLVWIALRAGVYSSDVWSMGLYAVYTLASRERETI